MFSLLCRQVHFSAVLIVVRLQIISFFLIHQQEATLRKVMWFLTSIQILVAVLLIPMMVVKDIHDILLNLKPHQLSKGLLHMSWIARRGTLHYHGTKRRRKQGGIIAHPLPTNVWLLKYLKFFPSPSIVFHFEPLKNSRT